MVCNLEQALVNVITTNQKVVLSSVFDAYMRVAGFKLRTQQALNAFERALDKHPDSADEVDSDFAKLIAELRQNWWHLRLMVSQDAEGKCNACPSCGVMTFVERMLSGDSTPWNAAFPEEEKLPVRLKNPKIRRVKKRRVVTTPFAFDPYGPSTSASSM